MFENFFNPYHILVLVVKTLVFFAVAWYGVKFLLGFTAYRAVGKKVKQGSKDFELWVKNRHQNRKYSDEAVSLASIIIQQLIVQSAEDKKKFFQHIVNYAALNIKMVCTLTYKNDIDLEHAFDIVRRYFFMTFGTYSDPRHSNMKNQIECTKEVAMGINEVFYPVLKMVEDKNTGELKVEELPTPVLTQELSNFALVKVHLCVPTFLTSKEYDFRKH